MKRALLFFTLFALSAPVAAQRTLSLEEAQQIALERNHDLRIATLAQEQASHVTDIVRAQRLPRVDLSAGYTHVSEVGSIDIDVPGLMSRSISFGDGNIYESALTVSMPLFTGFRLDAMQQLQETQHAITGVALEGTRMRVFHTVALMYYRAQLGQRSVSIYDEQLSYLGKQLDVIKALHAQGQVLAYDTLLLSTRAGALRIERANANADTHNAKLQLATLIGLSDDEFVIEETMRGSGSSVLDGDLTSLLQTAYEARHELRIIHHQQSAQSLRIRSEKAAYLPSVNAFASLRYGKPGVDQVSNEWMDYYTAGLYLQWNLWNWGGDKARVEQQEIATRSMDAEEARLKAGIVEQIKRLRNDIHVLRETTALLDAQIAQESLKQNMLRARLEQGLATATEVVDAETALTTVRLRREQNGIARAMKLTELAAAIGDY